MVGGHQHRGRRRADGAPHLGYGVRAALEMIEVQVGDDRLRRTRPRDLGRLVA